MALQLYSQPLRPPQPLPLVERLIAHEPEVQILRSFRNRALLQTHRTAFPWCTWNQVEYLEASNSEDGLTPLHVASVMNKAKVAVGILEGGARPDPKDNRGRTPLMFAAREGALGFLEILLNAGASAAATDMSGRNVLFYALQSDRNAAEATEKLIEAGADVCAHDIRGVTPLMLASSLQSQPLVDLLLQHGARALRVDFAGLRARDYAYATGAHDHKESPRKESLLPLSARLTRPGRNAASRYRRWDEKGEIGVEQSFFREERRLWGHDIPGITVSEATRLQCGLPKLESGSSCSLPLMDKKSG